MSAEHQIREKTFKGKTFKFACVEHMEMDPSWWSFTDEDSVREEFWNVGEGDTVFDIGAAYGSYTMCALALGAQHVFAWSPQSHPRDPTLRDASLLRESLELNEWGSRCSIYEEGLYSKPGYLNASTQEFIPLEPRPSPPPNETNGDIIKVRPFADWYDAEFSGKGFRPHGKVWVKIDTEGAEPEILKSLLRPLISPCSPNILVENHNFKRASLEQEVRDLVTSWGYREIATRPYYAVSHTFYTV